jgi:hypothetical protein
MGTPPRCTGSIPASRTNTALRGHQPFNSRCAAARSWWTGGVLVGASSRCRSRGRCVVARVVLDEALLGGLAASLAIDLILHSSLAGKRRCSAASRLFQLCTGRARRLRCSEASVVSPCELATCWTRRGSHAGALAGRRLAWRATPRGRQATSSASHLRCAPASSRARRGAASRRRSELGGRGALPQGPMAPVARRGARRAARMLLCPPPPRSRRRRLSPALRVGTDVAVVAPVSGPKAGAPLALLASRRP